MKYLCFKSLDELLASMKDPQDTNYQNFLLYVKKLTIRMGTNYCFTNEAKKDPTPSLKLTKPFFNPMNIIEWTFIRHENKDLEELIFTDDKDKELHCERKLINQLDNYYGDIHRLWKEGDYFVIHAELNFRDFSGNYLIIYKKAPRGVYRMVGYYPFYERFTRNSTRKIVLHYADQGGIAYWMYSSDLQFKNYGTLKPTMVLTGK